MHEEWERGHRYGQGAGVPAGAYGGSLPIILLC